MNELALYISQVDTHAVIDDDEQKKTLPKVGITAVSNWRLYTRQNKIEFAGVQDEFPKIV